MTSIDPIRHVDIANRFVIHDMRYICLPQPPTTTPKSMHWDQAQVPMISYQGRLWAKPGFYLCGSNCLSFLTGGLPVLILTYLLLGCPTGPPEPVHPTYSCLLLNLLCTFAAFPPDFCFLSSPHFHLIFANSKSYPTQILFSLRSLPR